MKTRSDDWNQILVAWLTFLLAATLLSWLFSDEPVVVDPYGLQDVPECYDMRGQC